MRIAAMVLGIVAGVFGILVALIYMGLNRVGSDADNLKVFFGFLTLLIAVAAIVGGALANKYPKASWITLLSTGILGFIVLGAFWHVGWVIPGTLLFTGSILEYFSSRTNNEIKSETQ